MTVPCIRTLRWTERHTAANIIATSLHPSCLAEWLIPDINHRHPVLAAVAEIWVEHALFRPPRETPGRPVRCYDAQPPKAAAFSVTHCLKVRAGLPVTSWTVGSTV